MNAASFVILVGPAILFWILIIVLAIALKRFVVKQWKQHRGETS
jgi:hypothetical protein